MAHPDDGRRLVAGRGLTARAVTALTPMMADVGFDRLAEVKGLLKRFFSDQGWGPADDDALARSVGAGEGTLREELAAGLWLIAGWEDGRFRLTVEADEAGGVAADEADEAGGVEADEADESAMASSFRSGVVPEATPNPRTLRFATARRRQAASRSFTREAAASDARVDRLFAVSEEVVDVLVGPDFVAVSLARPGRWPALLEPVLTAVAEGFGGTDEEAAELGATTAGDRTGGRTRPREGGQTRLEQAWNELGHLRPAQPADLAEVLAAASDPEPARRQVAASLLGEAPEPAAAQAWAALAVDPSRAVRRAAVDAVVDGAREPLRPVLERALGDSDAWVRWKAVHGLGALGAAPSEEKIAALQADPDFRVRLEAATALGRPMT